MKTLALTYPFAHNLRYLLALKARQDEHPDADRMLTAASVYSIDRTQLFLLTSVKVQLVQPVPIVMEEAVLELKPIAVVQQELVARAPLARMAQAEPPVVQEAKPVPEIKKEPEPEAVKPVETIKEPPAVAQEESFVPHIPLAQPFAVWISHFKPPVLDPGPAKPPVAATKEPEPAKAPQPAPPVTALEPVERHAAENEDLDSETPPLTVPVTVEPAKSAAEPSGEPQPAPPVSAHMLAERSVTENKDVISETLARLLVKQGYREKAIVMYERLSLAFPDKSAYFAAEIEKLKK